MGTSVEGFRSLIATGLILAAPTLGAQIEWWVANPLVKVKAADQVPEMPEKRAEIFAARNEFEPFQIVLRASEVEVRNVDIDCSSLRNESGNEIPKSNVTIYAERFIKVTQPSLASGVPGEWPDPLIPRVDRYVNEKRNAFPLTLVPDRNQPVWIEVYIPPSAKPGEYTGSISVSRGGASEFTVPLHLTVWAFTLPSTSSLKSSFGLNGTTVLKQHLGSYTSDEDLYKLARLYEKAALLHRVSVYGGSGAPPKYRYAGGEMKIDWGAYDAEVGPFLNGTALGSGPLSGAKATSADLRGPATFDTPEQQGAYWAGWMKHFEEKGWSDRLFLYLWDEPAAVNFPKVVERGRAALAAVPELRTLLTAPFFPNLADVVRIWVPLVNCLVNKPGVDPFCPGAGSMEDYAREREQGKSLWFYQSCASHGCNVPGGEYFEGWPSYMIDAAGPANRVMQWVAWKYGIEGELYFSMNEAYAHNDPWTAIRLFGGNGDGTLFYPGVPSKIGGSSDIPIESIRLKLIREGLEDYEYLALLAKSSPAKAAEYAGRIVDEPYAWETDPEEFLSVRREMGQTLHEISRQPNVGNAR